LHRLRKLLTADDKTTRGDPTIHLWLFRAAAGLHVHVDLSVYVHALAKGHAKGGCKSRRFSDGRIACSDLEINLSGIRPRIDSPRHGHGSRAQFKFAFVDLDDVAGEIIRYVVVQRDGIADLDVANDGIVEANRAVGSELRRGSFYMRPAR